MHASAVITVIFFMVLSLTAISRESKSCGRLRSKIPCHQLQSVDCPIWLLGAPSITKLAAILQSHHQGPGGPAICIKPMQLGVLQWHNALFLERMVWSMRRR